MSGETSEGPVRWTDINGGVHTTGTGTMRSFGLNSAEFCEVMCEPSYRPWIPNGALGKAPRTCGPAVVVELRRG